MGDGTSSGGLWNSLEGCSIPPSRFLPGRGGLGGGGGDRGISHCGRRGVGYHSKRMKPAQLSAGDMLTSYDTCHPHFLPAMLAAAECAAAVAFGHVHSPCSN